MLYAPAKIHEQVQRVAHRWGPVAAQRALSSYLVALREEEKAGRVTARQVVAVTAAVERLRGRF